MWESSCLLEGTELLQGSWSCLGDEQADLYKTFILEGELFIDTRECMCSIVLQFQFRNDKDYDKKKITSTVLNLPLRRWK